MIHSFLKLKDTSKVMFLLLIVTSFIFLKNINTYVFDISNYFILIFGLILGVKLFIEKDRYFEIVLEKLDEMRNRFYNSRVYFMKKKIMNKLNEKALFLQVLWSEKSFLVVEKVKLMFFGKETQEISLKNQKELVEQFDSKANETIVLYINICCFNEINTIFGYEMGNKLLLSFADRLNQNYFDCYRIHGDEFVVISHSKATEQEIDIFTNYVFDLLSKEAFKVDEEEIFLTVHMGISTSSCSGESCKTDISKLVYKANIAMKYAKSKKVQYAIYNSELMNISGDNYEYFIKKQIIMAINSNNIFAVYQPIVDNRTNEIVKYESLIRINGVENRIINPVHFLELSKECNLYSHLTKFMINEVFNKVMNTDYKISINISVTDIINLSTNNLIFSKLKKMPQEKRENIIFELLESEEIKNYSQVEDFINILKSYGCKVAIDDFGSGYSNFNHILNLNIDYLKIDSSIIKNILEDKTYETIVRLIIDLTRDMKIETIAEFVCSKDIFEKIKELGIDYSQGYYISEPIKLNNSY